jgi:hypothetical protein
MTTTERRCGTCRFLDVPPDNSGRRVVRAVRLYKCKFVVEMQPLPDSVALDWRYEPLTPLRWMDPREGTKCPVWEPKP